MGENEPIGDNPSDEATKEDQQDTDEVPVFLNFDIFRSLSDLQQKRSLERGLDLPYSFIIEELLKTYLDYTEAKEKETSNSKILLLKLRTLQAQIQNDKRDYQNRIQQIQEDANREIEKIRQDYKSLVEKVLSRQTPPPIMVAPQMAAMPNLPPNPNAPLPPPPPPSVNPEQIKQKIADIKVDQDVRNAFKEEIRILEGKMLKPSQLKDITMTAHANVQLESMEEYQKRKQQHLDDVQKGIFKRDAMDLEENSYVQKNPDLFKSAAKL